MGLSSKQVSSDHLELNWPQTTVGSDPNPRTTPMKRPLPTQQPEPLKCPRCDSSNTKFCYYNNYNKTQPRHFCKACKRHWTKGGTLRNVPVGGGRKNKRIKRPNAVVKPASTNSDQLGFHDQKYVFSDDHKGVLDQSYSDIDQVSWDFNGFGGTTTVQQELPHQNLGFSILSNLSSIDTNPSSITPTCFSPLLAGFKDDSTRMMMGGSTAMNLSQPWMQVPSTSNLLEANYWSWNDIDSMVQADLNKPFEDPQLKP